MPNSRITISYQNHSIRIYGLPDEPLFNFQDINRIVSTEKNVPLYFSLVPDLEIFTIDQEKVSVVNNAGVYKMIFKATAKKNELIHFERYFIEEVEPALRKYGYPAEKSSC